MSRLMEKVAEIEKEANLLLAGRLASRAIGKAVSGQGQSALKTGARAAKQVYKSGQGLVQKVKGMASTAAGSPTAPKAPKGPTGV